MDLMKTLMLYMAVVLSGAAQSGIEMPPTPVPTAVVEVISVTQTPALPTETPAPTGETVTYPTLRNGDRGDSVLELQRRLSALGYEISKLDGVYGGNTQRAVQAFQRDHGLTVDGVAGPKTQAVLYALPLPDALTEGGSAVTIDDNRLTVAWLVDANGTAYVSLRDLAAQDGWEAAGEDAYVTRAGIKVACTRTGDECTVTVNGEAVPDGAILREGEAFVSAALLEALGASVTVESDTLALRFGA